MEMRYQGEHSNHSKNSYPSPTLRSTVRTFFTWHMVAVYTLRFRSISSERSVTANLCGGVRGRRGCGRFLTEILARRDRLNKKHHMSLRRTFHRDSVVYFAGIREWDSDFGPAQT